MGVSKLKREDEDMTSHFVVEHLKGDEVGFEEMYHWLQSRPDAELWESQRMKRKQARKRTYHGIPRSSAQAESIVAHAETADTVVVALQCSNLVTTENVPDLVDVSKATEASWETCLALKVVITSE
jgi:hypothetical protein